MINFVTALWFGAVGACVGSFLNVVAYRRPRGLSVVWQPSHCPSCGCAIRAWHNVPVLGWLVLRGKCRDCRSPIAVRYVLVEAAVGAAFVALAYGELFRAGANLLRGPLTRADDALDMFLRPCWPLIGIFVAHCLLISLLACLALLHYDRRAAPPEIAMAAMLVALLLAAAAPEAYGTSWDRWIDAAPAVAGRLDGLLGSCVGVLPLAAGLALMRRHGQRHAWLNASCGVGAIGGVLGTQAAIGSLLLAGLMGVLGERGGSRPGAGFGTWTWIVVAVAALLQILCGRMWAYSVL